MSEEKGKYEKMFENIRVEEIELDKPFDTNESKQYTNMFSNPIIPDISVGSQEKYIGWVITHPINYFAKSSARTNPIIIFTSPTNSGLPQIAILPFTILPSYI